MDAVRSMVVPLALIAVATLGGCASGDASTSAAAGSVTPVRLTATAGEWPPRRNETDGNFALELVNRADRATRLANQVPRRTNSAQVAQFAAASVAGERRRRDEVDVLLRRWCLYAPGATEAGADSGPEAGETELAQANGAEFDRRFLALMVANHEAAVTISAVELRDGRSAEAKALAQNNIEIRRAEIATARDLLES